MKKYFLLSSLILVLLQGYAQLKISTGAQWVNSGNVTVSVQDLDFLNNGNFIAGNSLVKFTGSNDKNIGGSSVTTFYDLEIAKTGSKKLLLQSDINLDHQLNFTSGLLDLNQKNLSLATTAFLNNENENSRMTGLNGGEASITVTLNAPNSFNPGNLGSIISSAANLGSVTVKRGHKTQTGTGLTSSTNRYFNIQPANNSNLNATFRFKYFDAELNGQNEGTMIMFRSADGGINWTNQPVNGRDVVANWVEKTGINSFSLWTLSGALTSPLPITGLEFLARRINSSHVKLDWKTIQEMNNLGFYIERKKEMDNDFASTGFVNSKAFGGNSSLPLEYEKLDTNSFSGRSYYRLKQVDVDGNFSYSVIRLVTGETEKQITLKVWPVPAAGDFNIVVQGIGKNETVQLYDAAGKLIRTIPVADNIPQKVNRLPQGSYFIRLSGDKNISQKLIAQ